MNKKCFAGLGAVILGASLLCGCSSPAPQQDSQISTTVETTLTAPSYEAQIRLLVDRVEEWNQDDGVLPYYYHQYTVTDLDRNGRLEILAIDNSAPLFTYGKMYEISEDGSALLECAIPCDDGQTLPKMIVDSVPAAYDPMNGTYYYLFLTDCNSLSIGYGEIISSLHLNHGVLSNEILGRSFVREQDGMTNEQFSRDGLLTTPEEYEAIIPEFQAKHQAFTANFEWFQVEDGTDVETLTRSFETFHSSLPSTTVDPTPTAPNYQEQLRLLADTQSQWQQQEEPGAVYHYTVTDLDWNGRLEILAMSSRGTGAFTYGTIFEVNADGTSLLECSLPFGDGELPEMICDFVPAAFDPADGTYYYLFRDDLKNGYAEYYQSIQAVRLENGVISSNTLGRMSLVATDGVPHEEYYKDDQPITPEEYEAIIPAFRAELEGFTANLKWFTLENSIDEATFVESWEIFRSSRN